MRLSVIFTFPFRYAAEARMPDVSSR